MAALQYQHLAELDAARCSLEENSSCFKIEYATRQQFAHSPVMGAAAMPADTRNVRSPLTAVYPHEPPKFNAGGRLRGRVGALTAAAPKRAAPV